MMLDTQTDEKLIAQLFGTQPDSVVWFVPVFDSGNSKLVVDFTVRYCNSAAANILGADSSAIIGSTLLNTSLMDKVSLARIYEQCVNVWDTGEALEFTYHSPGFDKYFNVQRSKVMNGVLSITRDRTSEVRAEKERERQSILLSKIVNNSPAAIVLCQVKRDHDNRILDFDLIMVNEKLAKDLNRSKEELQSMTYSQVHPAVKTNGFHEILSCVAETGRRFNKEVYVESLGGWLLLSVDKVDDDKLLATYLNINDRKGALEKIEEQAQLLSLMLNSSLNGLYTLEAARDNEGAIIDFRMTHVNDVFCKMSGRKAEQLIGKLMGEIFPDTKKSGIFERNRQVLATGIGIQQELHYKGDGVDRWYQNSVNRVTNDQIVIAFYDITPLKQAAVELEKANQELQKSNERLSDFTHIASHDLNEPLRKIITFINLIDQQFGQELSTGVRDYFTRISKTALRMQTLVNDLLTYSKISHSESAFEKIRLDSILQDVQSDLETVIQAKRATIVVNTLPVISGDRTQISQVFQNLMSNALKFQKDNDVPFIEIRYEGKVVQGEPYYKITVRDNGIGFQSEEADKIFNVFQRLHGRHEYEGTGIGLAIVQKVMENHGGYVTATSEPGVGSCFNLFFPTDNE